MGRDAIAVALVSPYTGLVRPSSLFVVSSPPNAPRSRMVDDARAAEIRRVFRRQVRRYPALGTRPGHRALYRICESEGVQIVYDDRLPTAGALVRFLDVWTLFLSRKLAWRLTPPTIVHELAHLWCHADGPIYTTSPEEDPREEEADYLVSLVYGPDYVVFPLAELRPDAEGRFLDRRPPFDLV